MAEWSNAPDSKSGLRATVTGVRIPLSPPYKLCLNYQFFNPHRQAANLIGFFSIRSLLAIEESGLIQGHDAD